MAANGLLRVAAHVLFATAPWGMSDSQHGCRIAPVATNRVFPPENPDFQQWHAACSMANTQLRKAGFVADTKTKKRCKPCAVPAATVRQPQGWK
jgi:hypothetical protein